MIHGMRLSFDFVGRWVKPWSLSHVWVQRCC